MNSGYSPSTLPWRARTPNQPAPNTGMPVPMSTVANRSRARDSDGSSGGGNTARITSGSVSHTTVTAVDQIGAVTASTSRLRCCSGGRAPYRIVAISCPFARLPGLDDLLGIECIARGVGGIVGRVEWHAYVGDGGPDPVADLSQLFEVEAVHARGIGFDHHLGFGRRHVRERGAQRFGRVRVAAFRVRI